MLQLVANPHCEAATALLIYWRAQPQDFSEYANVGDVPDHERPIFELVKLIQERYAQEAFPVSEVFYDPRDEYGGLDEIEDSINHRCIPRQMFAPILRGR